MLSRASSHTEKISPPLASIAFIMASDVEFFTMKSGFLGSLGVSAISSSKPNLSSPLSLSCMSFAFAFLNFSSSFLYSKISSRTLLSKLEKRARMLALLPVELSPTPRTKIFPVCVYPPLTAFFALNTLPIAPLKIPQAQKQRSSIGRFLPTEYVLATSRIAFGNASMGHSLS